MTVLPPSAWPCGCKAVLIGNAIQATEWKLVYCPLHKAAPELLSACEQVSTAGLLGPARKAVKDAIALATGADHA